MVDTGESECHSEGKRHDVRCVAWILRNITDPEALEAAIRLAGTILWLEDGLNVEPPYDVIVSIFHSCLDSTGIVYPGLSDRAYHSARAMLWIHIRALCVSEEFPSSFPLPPVNQRMPGHRELSFILTLFYQVRSPWILASKSVSTESNTYAHMQWNSHALLHLCWVKQGTPSVFILTRLLGVPPVPWNTVPLDVVLNILLVWSIFLGYPVESEVLKSKTRRTLFTTFTLCHLLILPFPAFA